MDSKQDHIQLPALNLPHYEPELYHQEGKVWVFDPVRKKQLVLTPEEWVRQHWINYLIHHLNYPRGLFALEKGLKYNQIQKRTDLVIWDTGGIPYLLIECKAPNVSLTQKTMAQACLYHHELKSPYLIITNGKKHVFMRYDFESKLFNQEKDCPESPS
jgi:hypothetical protein